MCKSFPKHPSLEKFSKSLAEAAQAAAEAEARMAVGASPFRDTWGDTVQYIYIDLSIYMCTYMYMYIWV